MCGNITCSDKYYAWHGQKYELMLIKFNGINDFVELITNGCGAKSRF